MTTELKRELQARHVGLMALGSAIGTGLFLGSATAVQLTGPAVVFSYIISGLIAFVVLRALGEIMVHDPSRSLTNYISQYLGSFSGYCVSWSYWIYWVVVSLTQITAVSMYMSVWFPDVPSWIWALLSISLMGIANLISVKSLGEFGFWFALIKVLLIIALIIIGVWVIFFGIKPGDPSVGISNLWKNGGFFSNGIIGFLLSLQMVLFSYSGIEVIGLSANEMKDPKKNIPTVIGSTIFRIIVLYVGCMLVVLSIFPWNKLIIAHGSPFVAIFKEIGFSGAANVVNFVVITAALSSSNIGIFSGSRLLLNLSQDNKAPKIFSKLSKTGVPIYSVFTVLLFMAFGTWIDFLSSGQMFYWGASTVTLIGLLVWMAILYTQICFRKDMRKKKIETEIKYKMFLWPFSSWFAICFISFCIFLMAFLENKTRISFFVIIPFFIFISFLYYILGIYKKSKE